MIGIVICGSVALLLFFGVAERVFKSFGVAYWLAIIILGGLIAAAFVPTIYAGRVELSIAGFFAPLVFAAVFFFVASRTREAGRALVATSVAFALCLAARLLSRPISSRAAVTAIVGVSCGVVVFFTAGSRLAAVCALFLGLPLAEVAASAVELYVYSSPLRFGSAISYDFTILAAVVSVLLFELSDAVRRSRSRDRGQHAAGLSELAAEFDPDEYKRYFDE